MNYYYPPNWTPSDGSLNKFHGTHPLGNRASKLKSQGILVIRFEIPFNIWCDKCGSIITQGTRFNADKKAVGNYFSTRIYSFTFNCAKCKNKIEIQTDPKVWFIFIQLFSHFFTTHSFRIRHTKSPRVLRKRLKFLMERMPKRSHFLLWRIDLSSEVIHFLHSNISKKTWMFYPSAFVHPITCLFPQKAASLDHVILALQDRSKLTSDYLAANEAARKTLRVLSIPPSLDSISSQDRRRFDKKLTKTTGINTGLRLLPTTQEDGQKIAQFVFFLSFISRISQ